MMFNSNRLQPFYLNTLPKISGEPKVHRNFLFRFQYCGLSDEHAAQCVGVTVDQVYAWDDGEELPFSVKRVWMLESGRKLPKMSGFEGWSFRGGRIVTPDGIAYTSRQLSVALYLLDTK